MGVSTPEASQVMTLDRIIELQALTDQVYVDTAVAQYAVDLVMATREPAQRGLHELDPLIDFGVSPRASLGLVAAARGLAVLRGRAYTLPQDVFDVARDVLRHRMMLSYEALAQGLTADNLLHRILSVVAAAPVSPVELERKSEQAQDVANRASSVLTSAQAVGLPSVPPPTSPSPAPAPTPASAPTSLPSPAPAPGARGIPPVPGPGLSKPQLDDRG